MKNILLSVLCLTPVLSFADSAAIKKLNFKVDATYVRSKTSKEDIGNFTEFSGEIRIPVMNYIGLSLDLGLSKFNAKNNYIDSNSKSAGIGVIFRNPKLGAINAKYLTINTDYDDNVDSTDLDSIYLSGIWYINKFDIAVSRSDSKFNNTLTVKSSTLSTSYYISDNLKINGLIGKVDNLKNSDYYQIGLTYQPKYFNNTISAELIYNESDTFKQTLVAMSYYFNTKVSLFERDRNY